ncbi:MAG TPA: lysylphosphatidylglycerol synthase domain-containing protein [Steroidobacteraceae bacterium]|jgi:putative membrane protein
MKLAAYIALLIGLAALVYIVVQSDARAILTLIARAGWVLWCLVPLYALPLLPDCLGWRVLIPAPTRIAVLYWIAAVRQAVNRLLPVANIGGELVGMRLLAQSGVEATTAAATVIVELLVTLMSQCIFVAVGVATLLRITGAVQLSSQLAITVAACLPLLAVLVLLLRHGGVFERFQRFAQRLLGGSHPAVPSLQLGSQLDAAVRERSDAPLRLLRTAMFQLAGYLTGCLGTWAALYWLGSPVSFAAALVLESLSQAARQFIFIVPAGLGVQEISLLAVGHALGLGADVAIALSLAKRMAEIAFGVPALISWQWFEGRRWLRLRKSSG